MKGRSVLLIFLSIMVLMLSSFSFGALDGVCDEQEVLNTGKFPGASYSWTKTIDAIEGFNLTEIITTYPSGSTVVFNSSSVVDALQPNQSRSSYTIVTDYFSVIGGRSYALTNVSHTNSSDPTDVQYSCSLLPFVHPSTFLSNMIRTVTLLILGGGLLFLWIRTFFITKSIEITGGNIIIAVFITVLMLVLANSYITSLFL